MTEDNPERRRDVFSKRHWFRDWPDQAIPAVAAGAYVVWQGDQLIYAGMSGRQIEKNRHKRKYGLITRLDSHAKGRLSGDQFNVYVANRLVIPSLNHGQLAQFADGGLTLDLLTRQYIHQHFEYQYLVVKQSAEAFELERTCQRGEVFGQKPLLNPL
jgi:hypothetical protein